VKRYRMLKVGEIKTKGDEMSNFHHSTLESDRLVKILTTLRLCGKDGATTLHLAQDCNSTRPSSDISELRACGVGVACRYEGQSATGRKVYRYWLGEFAPNLEAEA